MSFRALRENIEGAADGLESVVERSERLDELNRRSARRVRESVRQAQTVGRSGLIGRSIPPLFDPTGATRGGQTITTNDQVGGVLVSSNTSVGGVLVSSNTPGQGILAQIGRSLAVLEAAVGDSIGSGSARRNDL